MLAQSRRAEIFEPAALAGDESLAHLVVIGQLREQLRGELEILGRELQPGAVSEEELVSYYRTASVLPTKMKR